MQITDIRLRAVHVNHRGNWLFVQVHTDAGLVGTGEASHPTDDRALAETLVRLRPRLIGLETTEIERLLNRFAHAQTGFITWTAISAIEQALWDVNGQAVGLPVYKMLGGQVNPRLRLYANVNRAAKNREPSSYAECAHAAVEQGFSAVKCAPFDEVSWWNLDYPEGRQAFEKGLERVQRIRAAIGDQVELSVDCHNRFDVPTARRVAKLLGPARLFWLEAPFPINNPVAYLQLKESLETRLAAGEELLGRVENRPFVETHAIDVLMFDVKHTGGLLEGKKIAALAEAFDVAVSPHSPAGPVAQIAAGHLCATLPNFLCLEYAWGEVPWRNDLVNGAEEIRDGCLVLSDRPGLGITLNEKVLAEHTIEL